MTMLSLGDYLRSLEEALLDPVVGRNRAALEKLLCEDFKEFGSSGRLWTRHQVVELLANEAFSPVLVEEFNYALLADSVALVTYRAVRGGMATQTSSLRSSIWVRGSRGVAPTVPPRHPGKLRKAPPYTSCRLKISSFSRHGHLAQPRQQTSRTATPTVTIRARRLPLVNSQ
jgi:hypothetical protein